MWLPRHIKGPRQTLSMIIILLLIISSFTIQASATLPRKLDQEVLAPPNGQAPDYNSTDPKCGACPCANPCGQPPPLPPLLPLPPPPPPPPPPSQPPPPKTPICTPPPPPPPPPRFIYVTGVPGEVTEVNNWYYSRAECNVAKKLLLLAGYFVLGILVVIE